MKAPHASPDGQGAPKAGDPVYRPTEAQFQATVLDYAKLRNWRVHHVRPARTAKGWRTPIQGDPGFPDLLMVRGTELIVAELKSDRGTLSDDQKLWLHCLGAACVETYVWRPRDFPEIERRLR